MALPNGARAKLALYFPQTDDLEAMRPVVEAALAANGHAPSECLANHSHSPQADVDAFNRLNDPASAHRVILLVNRGTEGWNCPSLFACALARNLQSSNNFVLQAATRCLRQVPGNSHKAKIYLSQDNYAVLDRQLQETYGESLSDLKQGRENLHHARIVLLKENIPPLALKRQIIRVRRMEAKIPETLELQRPQDDDPALTVQRYELAAQVSSLRVMRELGDALPVEAAIEQTDVRTAAADLAARYRLPLFAVLDALRAPTAKMMCRCATWMRWRASWKIRCAITRPKPRKSRWRWRWCGPKVSTKSWTRVASLSARRNHLSQGQSGPPLERG